jgi:hypothetical protein
MKVRGTQEACLKKPTHIESSWAPAHYIFNSVQGTDTLQHVTLQRGLAPLVSTSEIVTLEAPLQLAIFVHFYFIVS